MDANHLLYAMAVTQLLLNYNSQELFFCILHMYHFQIFLPGNQEA